MPSGWTRLLLEQFEFPFEVVYPKTLDAGNLSSKFDVLIFPSDLVPTGEGRGGGSGIPAAGRSGRVPRSAWLDYGGATVPQLKKFLEDGGTIVAVGRSAGLGATAGAADRQSSGRAHGQRCRASAAAREVLRAWIDPARWPSTRTPRHRRPGGSRGRVLRQQPGLYAGARRRRSKASDRSPGSIRRRPLEAAGRTVRAISRRRGRHRRAGRQGAAVPLHARDHLPRRSRTARSSSCLTGFICQGQQGRR